MYIVLYPDVSSSFITDSTGIFIEPEIRKEKELIVEAVYLSYSDKHGSIKGQVPIHNVDTSKEYTPFGKIFEFHAECDLEGKIYSDVWSFEKPKQGIYYSKTLGILAVRTVEGLFINDEL